MPTYKTTSVWTESGFGTNSDTFVICDTYEGLTDLEEAIDVSVFVWESTRRELDIDTGVYATPELSFSILGATAETDDDRAAVLFALEASGPSVRRYVARIINAADPDNPTSSEIEFRGVLGSTFDGEDISWGGPEFGTDPQPFTDWTATAQSYDVTELLAMPLEDAVFGPEDPETGERSGGIDGAWISANVGSELGYFHDESDDFGFREVRFGQMVNFGVLAQELLDRATADLGITVTFEAELTDIWALPARWNASDIPESTFYDAHKSRFVWRFRDGSTTAIEPFKIFPEDLTQIKAGDDIDGSLYVSWRLLHPTDEERPFSWLRYGTVAEWLYSVAASLNTFAQIEYETETEITVRFKAPTGIQKGPVFFKDAVTANIGISAEQADGEARPAYVGASWQMNAEGWLSNYSLTESGFVPNPAGTRPPSGGELLALSVSPTWRMVLISAGDTNEDIVTTLGWGIIPHNAVFVDNEDGSLSGHAAEGDPRFNAISLHSGLYIKTSGRSGSGEVGTVGRSQVLPVALVTSPLVGSKFYAQLSEMLNDLTTRNDFYFRAEYKIEVPGLSCFRAEPGGVQTWQNLQLGNVTETRGVNWVVQAYERFARKTAITLQYASRYPLPLEEPPSFLSSLVSSGSAPTPAELQARPPRVTSLVAGANIAALSLVMIGADGLAYRATARHEQYGRVIGIALEAAVTGGMISVRRFPCQVATGPLSGLAAGNKLYLRTASSGPNFSSSPLTDVTSTEDLFLEIGSMESDTVASFRQVAEFVFYPPIVGV